MPPWRAGLEAIVSFTGHAVFAVRPGVPDRLLAALGADGFGGAHDPRLITALAGPDGWIDSLDMLMASRGTGRAGVAPRLTDRPDLATHPRAMFAAGIRDHPRLMGYPDPRRSALAVVSRGDRRAHRGELRARAIAPPGGWRSELVRDALSAIPSGQLAVAAVAPGNAASVRALLAAGFIPLGSIQLFRCAGHPAGASR